MAGFIEKLIRKIKYRGRDVIVVSGLPRSGTSMMMKMLDAAGVPILTDNLRSADEDNPKGYYEFEPVKDLDKTEDKSWMEQAVGKVVKVIATLLQHLPENYNYKVIFMDRHVDEVISSQNKMLERRDEENPVEDEKLKQYYDMHLRKVKYLLKNEPQFEVLFINHRDCLSDPEGQARRVSEFLGGGLPIEKMAVVVDKNLYRNRR